MNLNQLKEQAQQDMANNAGEWGAADGMIDGKEVCVMAKKVGYNKPGRKSNIRFKVINK